MAADKLDTPAKIDNRMPGVPKSGHGTVPWAIKGELILNCNCTVFCPCVVSLGQHPPTEGYCQAWSGVRIDEGHYGDTDLSGLNVGLMLEIPGLMARGNWKAAAYIDQRVIGVVAGARHNRAVQHSGQRVSGRRTRAGGVRNRRQDPPPDGRQEDPGRSRPRVGP